MQYGTAELKVPAVVKPQTDTTAATASPTTVGEHMQTPDIVQGQLQMPAVTSQPGIGQLRLGLEKPQCKKFIPVLSPDMAPDLTLIQDLKHIKPVSCHSCIKYP